MADGSGETIIYLHLYQISNAICCCHFLCFIRKRRARITQQMHMCFFAVVVVVAEAQMKTNVLFFLDHSRGYLINCLMENNNNNNSFVSLIERENS